MFVRMTARIMALIAAGSIGQASATVVSSGSISTTSDKTAPESAAHASHDSRKSLVAQLFALFGSCPSAPTAPSAAQLRIRRAGCYCAWSYGRCRVKGHARQFAVLHGNRNPQTAISSGSRVQSIVAHSPLASEQTAIAATLSDMDVEIAGWKRSWPKPGR